MARYDALSDEDIDVDYVDQMGENYVARLPSEYRDKFKQIRETVDPAVKVYFVAHRPSNSSGTFRGRSTEPLVIKLAVPGYMSGYIRSLRIRVDDPECWALIKYDACLKYKSSYISGEEKCSDFGTTKWALSNLFNLYYRSIEYMNRWDSLDDHDSIVWHPPRREVSDTRPVRAIPRHDGLDEMNYETREPRRALPRDGAASGRARRSTSVSRNL